LVRRAQTRLPHRDHRPSKQEPGKDLWLVGGAGLAGTLYGEIDRLMIKRGPLAIGAGMPVFQLGFDLATWRLTEHHAVGDALVLTYDRAE
jgi:dihydrofolate reductase